MSNLYDIIVIGVGSMGSAVCYSAAKRGMSVLGLDQFDPPHAQGSHSGQTRIIRQAYFEQSDYVPLLQKAYTHWTELEAESGQRLFNKTGLLYAGDATGPLITGVKKSTKTHGLNVDELGEAERKKKYPQCFLQNDQMALFEPNAGFLNANQCITTLLNLAKSHGADIRGQHKVISWELRNDYAVVFTNNESFYAKKIIITSGAYAQNLLPRLRNTLTVTRQRVFWFNPKNPTLFKAPNYTCWNIQDKDFPGLFYGFPYIDEKDDPDYWGLKIAYHHPGEATHPSEDNGIDNEQAIEKELTLIRSFISKYFPKALSPLLRHQTCYYSNSPDENFIIDHLPNTAGRVIFGAGFSGHGFKFVPLMGEVLVDLAKEERSIDGIDFLKLERIAL